MGDREGGVDEGTECIMYIVNCIMWGVLIGIYKHFNPSMNSGQDSRSFSRLLSVTIR